MLIPTDEKLRRTRRRSLAYFVNPDDTVMVKPMKFKPEADPPRPERVNDILNKPTNAKDYLLSKFHAAIKGDY